MRSVAWTDKPMLGKGNYGRATAPFFVFALFSRSLCNRRRDRLFGFSKHLPKSLVFAGGRGFDMSFFHSLAASGRYRAESMRAMSAFAHATASATVVRTGSDPMRSEYSESQSEPDSTAGGHACCFR